MDATRVVALALAGAVAACSDSPQAACARCAPSGPALRVSAPFTMASLVLPAAPTNAGAYPAVWVSLGPGSGLAGGWALVGRLGATERLTVPLVSGGFDPVELSATLGDTIVVTALDPLGALQVLSAPVPSASRPAIVRTEPASPGPALARNSPIVVVFSEPVSASSITRASVRLLGGAHEVPGEVSVRDGEGTEVEFAPAVELGARASYMLVVGRSVTDRAGVPLEDAFEATFETGLSDAGPVATVRVLPDVLGVSVLVGSSVQLKAIPLDARGFELSARSPAWATTAAAVATVTAQGTVVARGLGVARIDATVDGVTAPGAVIRVCVARGTAPAIDTLCVMPIIPPPQP